MRKYVALDGLRGVAALCVAVLHLRNVFDLGMRVPNAPLGVDFFFMLSGFVLAHAYTEKLERGEVREYLLARAIRLYPLIILGTLLGVLWRLHGALNVPALIPLSLTTLPRLTEGTISPLNPPAWSLFFELVASGLFAFGLWRWKLGLTVALSTAAFLLVLIFRDFHVGWTAETFPLGFIRVAFGFGVGVWLYRNQLKVPSLHVGWLSLALAAILLWPSYSEPLHWFALFVAFPFIVLSAAGRDDWPRFCSLSGELSYPLYITHYPLFMLFSLYWNNWAAAFVFAVGFSFAASRFCDIPVRRWLARPRGKYQTSFRSQES